MTRSAYAIISGLCDHFMLVYDAWDEKHSDALGKKMLEEDVKQLGLYFGTLDEFGQLSELTLLAECLAHIRIFDSGLDQSKQIDFWTDEVMDELQDAQFICPLIGGCSIKDVVHGMKTWNLTKELISIDRITREDANMLQKSYLELADVFFMRDGNITSEEMQAMREFSEALKF